MFDTDPCLARHLSTALYLLLWLVLCPLICTAPMIALFAFLAFPGIKLAANVSATIARDQAQGIHHLLGVSPNGEMGVSWMICTVYRDGRPPDFFLTRDEIFLLVFFCSISTLAFGLAGFAIFFIGAVVVAASYIDFAQSMVLGSLVGIWAAHAGSRMDARLQAVAAYSTLQALVYLPVLLLGVTLFASTLGNSTPDTVLKITAIILALVCLLYALRESMIVIVWRIISRVLNADFTEIASATYHSALR